MSNVRVRDAFGKWHDAVALSDVEGTHRDLRKIHDFPIVWVSIGGKERVPWPFEDVVYSSVGQGGDQP